MDSAAIQCRKRPSWLGMPVTDTRDVGDMPFRLVRDSGLILGTGVWIWVDVIVGVKMNVNLRVGTRIWLRHYDFGAVSACVISICSFLSYLNLCLRSVLRLVNTGVDNSCRRVDGPFLRSLICTALFWSLQCCRCSLLQESGVLCGTWIDSTLCILFNPVLSTANFWNRQGGAKVQTRSDEDTCGTVMWVFAVRIMGQRGAMTLKI